MLYLALVMAVAALGIAWLGGRAYRDEYLMVLHWHDAGALYFERRDDGRYAAVPLAALPLVALRYGLRMAAPRATPVEAGEKRIAAAPALAHR